jgi:hypothetical protein
VRKRIRASQKNVPITPIILNLKSEFTFLKPDHTGETEKNKGDGKIRMQLDIRKLNQFSGRTEETFLSGEETFLSG